MKSTTIKCLIFYALVKILSKIEKNEKCSVFIIDQQDVFHWGQPDTLQYHQVLGFWQLPQYLSCIQYSTAQPSTGEVLLASTTLLEMLFNLADSLFLHLQLPTSYQEISDWKYFGTFLFRLVVWSPSSWSWTELIFERPIAARVINNFGSSHLSWKIIEFWGLQDYTPKPPPASGKFQKSLRQLCKQVEKFRLDIFLLNRLT